MNKKLNKKKVCIVLLSIIVIVFFGIFIRNTFSRYQSKADSQVEPDIAFWLVSDTIQDQNIIFENLEPGQTKECVFSVSNNNGTIRTNASIEYKIIVNTTANLPLTYEIYQKTDTGETLCTTESRLYQEEGTYYKEFTVTGLELGHLQDETEEFIIKATFPSEKNDAQLADLIECVNLKIDAKQKISE